MMAGGELQIDGLALVAGGANIIMQLSWPSVGYGVHESTVESGRIFDHPIKRTRTTLTYLVLAATGTDEEKAQFRRGVNRAHRQVHSTTDSPVEYDAFDPELQLWVAACIYRGFEDTHRVLRGEIPEHHRDAYYQRGSAFATTLQVPQAMWPADRDAFEDYWNGSLGTVAIDETVREYLHKIATMKFAHPLVQFLFGRMNLFLTKGFLPPLFRRQMHYTWTDADQRRFDRLMRVLAAVNRHAPKVLREFPYNYLMADLRWRMRTGRALV